MKRALLIAATAVIVCLAAGAGSASALNYVCYYSPDITRTATFSTGVFSQTSTVKFQYGQSCTGQRVTMKTKTIDTTVTFKNSFPGFNHSAAGTYLAKNGQAYASVTYKSASCTGNCSVSLSWAPYIETNYDASNYSFHGNLTGVGANGFCGWDHYYDPSSYLEYTCGF